MSDFKLFETWYHENFSSSLLAFAMRQSQDFSHGVMHLLCPKFASAEILIREIEREYPLDLFDPKRQRRADIFVEAAVDGRPLLCLIEAKIQSGEQERQLADYRACLKGQSADIKLLATLSKYPIAWSAKPDVELRWANLTPLVAQMEERARDGSFEKSFWSQFRNHLEKIMATFQGFTLGFASVHGLMQEIDLFLDVVLGKLGITRRNVDWKADRAAYWLPNEEATVGFYWWQKWEDQSSEDTLFVVKYKPQEKRIRIASLQEVVAQCAVAKQQGSLDQYVAKVASEIRKALEQT